MLSKILCVINWLSKSMPLILIFQVQDIEKRIEDVDKKIPNTSGLVNKTYYNAKITGIKNKIPRTIHDITNLVTKSALNTKSAEVKNKIPDTRGFLSTPEFDRLTIL